MRKLSAKWVPKFLNADQKVNGACCLSNFWNFFGVIHMISCRHNWWLWTKAGSITVTWRQSNNQWSGSVAAYPTLKNSKCKNLLENSRLDFLGSRRHPPHRLSSKGPNYQHRVLLISAGAIGGHFERKTLREVHQQSLVLTTMPQLTRHLQPRRNWPTWASSVLITHPILRMWSHRTTPVPWTEKTIGRSPFFIRRGGNCCRRDLVGRTTFWIFFGWLAKVRAMG